VVQKLRVIGLSVLEALRLNSVSMTRRIYYVERGGHGSIRVHRDVHHLVYEKIGCGSLANKIEPADKGAVSRAVDQAHLLRQGGNAGSVICDASSLANTSDTLGIGMDCEMSGLARKRERYIYVHKAIGIHELPITRVD